MKLNYIIVSLVSVLFIHCAGETAGETANTGNERRIRTVAVETITLQEDTLKEKIKVIGTVEAYDDATVSAEASGRIQYIAPAGQRVAAGDIIARLDDRLLQAQYGAARVQYELAVDTYNRQHALYTDSIISELQYNNIRTQRDQAKAQYEQAKKQLRDAHIEAPFDGRIEERYVKSGELINPGMPVARIVNTGRVKITAGIPDRYAADIREGARATIYLRGNDNQPREGFISFAGNVIDPDTRTYPIEIDLPNPGGILKSEMVVEVYLLRRTIDNTLVIPRTAIIRDEIGPNVFIVRREGENSRAELVPVTLGASSDMLIEIIDGITTGDEVIVSGHRNLNQGDGLDILQTNSRAEDALTIYNQRQGQ